MADPLQWLTTSPTEPTVFAGVGQPTFVTPVDTMKDLGVPQALVETIALKQLLAYGQLSGREFSLKLGLPFKLVQPLLEEMKQRLLMVHINTEPFGDFSYALTPDGEEAAFSARKISNYNGTVPVAFGDYVEAMQLQALPLQQVGPEQLKQAFADIVLEDNVFDIIGPAIAAGKGIFVYGAAGNGKTTLCERIRDCYTQGLYIPQALFVEGEIIQLFDAQVHQVLTPPQLKLDNRWVFIQRPSIVVGGELTMDALELTINTHTGVAEAPLHMKANGGVFLIDDFGRQRIDHQQLLNRWIVPLEKRHDYLTLANGRKIQVPFEALILFSTNLDPTALMDEAFLRRIPYKINMPNPSEAAFKQLFQQQCHTQGVYYQEELVDWLLATYYYAPSGKAYAAGLRACHPRDLVAQLVHHARFYGQAAEMTQQSLERACEHYFVAVHA